MRRLFAWFCGVMALPPTFLSKISSKSAERAATTIFCAVSKAHIREWEAEFGYRGITPRAMALAGTSQACPRPCIHSRESEQSRSRNSAAFSLGAGPAPRGLSRMAAGALDLANAIADRNNPLTARVIVNRVWQWHFGRGIVNSPSDFGTRGDLPTHPELLDYLATRFMEEGWSIKKLHKWIMLSSTYQQSSADRPDARAVDPENKLVWRMNRQRLDFESLRDSILFVAGQLDLTARRIAILADGPARRAAPHRLRVHSARSFTRRTERV